MKIVNTKGQQCPAPLIETRKALRDAEPGETFEVLTDNKTSFENISRYLTDNKIAFLSMENGGTWSIQITPGEHGDQLKNAEEYCTTEVPHLSKGDFVIAFTSDKMGEGDEELGRILVINFIKAVKDLDVLPSKMIFYNNGVKLGSDDSPVAEHLKELQKMGVVLLFCATCTKFYALEDKIKIGILSNMFEIAQAMASAGNIIKP
jgi:selenium metabolism protein YedF